MVYPGALIAAATAILLASPAYAGGLYPKSSAVLQVDAKNYDSLIAKSNYTSVSYSYTKFDSNQEQGTDNHRSSSSMHHGVDTARVFSQRTSRQQRSSPAVPKWLLSTAMKITTSNSVALWASRASQH